MVIRTLAILLLSLVGLTGVAEASASCCTEPAVETRAQTTSETRRAATTADDIATEHRSEACDRGCCSSRCVLMPCCKRMPAVPPVTPELPVLKVKAQATAWLSLASLRPGHAPLSRVLLAQPPPMTQTRAWVCVWII